MNSLKISILIAAYNIENYIVDCVNSCICQSYNNIEIIIVNDGSFDNTQNLVHLLASKDRRIIQIDKENGGLVSARKTGIDMATGDYIFFLDGDDVIPQDAIEKLVAGIDHSSDIILGKFEIHSYNETIQYKTHELNDNTGIGFINELLLNAFASIVGNLYKRELFNYIDFPFSLYNAIGEDLATNIQLGFYAKRVVQIDNITYLYKQRDSSIIGKARVESIWVLGFGAFIYVTEFLNKKNILNKVIPGYLKLLNTYIMGYLVSDFQFKPYKNEIKKALHFACINSTNQNTKLSVRVIYKLALWNLSIARFFSQMYLRLK